MARVLLIDDDRLVRQSIRVALADSGHHLDEAENGAEGLAHALATPPDLVICDLIMPEREGIETIIALKRMAPCLPIIAISGGVTNSKLYLDIAGKIGARRILPKPFTPKELIHLIEQVLEEAKQPDPPA